ncbi:unnamed protein product [Owenia fusiformis]|uniref:non-specific serine/threonine protein kinase n=1 Tax=Owenia fusiformis TaxID=6347 RepID=A0A8S4NMZ5_OWEFU|nr:unnamed protein product [Owenia fusiformis]
MGIAAEMFEQLEAYEWPIDLFEGGRSALCVYLEDSNHKTAKLLNIRGHCGVTDSFLFHGVQEANQHAELGKTLQSVEVLDLTGCFQLTDTGLIYLIGHLPNLTHILLGGCRHVTEASIQKMLEMCSNLMAVVLDGCNIGLIPEHPNSRPITTLLSSDAKKALKKVRMGNYKYLQGLNDEEDDKSVVMVTNGTICVGLADKIASKSIVLIHMEKEYKSLLGEFCSITITCKDDVFGSGQVESSGRTLNVFECHQDLAFHLIPPEAVCVIIPGTDPAVSSAVSIMGLVSYISARQGCEIVIQSSESNLQSQLKEATERLTNMKGSDNDESLKLHFATMEMPYKYIVTPGCASLKKFMEENQKVFQLKLPKAVIDMKIKLDLYKKEHRDMKSVLTGDELNSLIISLRPDTDNVSTEVDAKMYKSLHYLHCMGDILLFKDDTIAVLNPELLQSILSIPNNFTSVCASEFGVSFVDEKTDVIQVDPALEKELHVCNLKLVHELIQSCYISEDISGLQNENSPQKRVGFLVMDRVQSSMPMPLEHYECKDAFAVQCVYVLPIWYIWESAWKSVLSQAMAYHPSNTVLLWDKGIVKEIGGVVLAVKRDDARIVVTCSVPWIKQDSGNSSEADDVAQPLMSTYCQMLQSTLQRFNCIFKVDKLASEKMSQEVPKKATHHNFPANSGGNAGHLGVTGTACGVCGLTTSQLSLEQNNDCDLLHLHTDNNASPLEYIYSTFKEAIPKFSTSLNKISEDASTPTSCIIKFPQHELSAGDTLNLPSLFAFGKNEIQLSILDISLAGTFKDGEDSTTIDMCIEAISGGSKKFEFKENQLNIGDNLKLQLQAEEEPLSRTFNLRIFQNGVEIGHLSCEKHICGIKLYASKRYMMALDLKKSGYGMGNCTISVGMRLEAKDRKTPSLICVATITAIKEDSPTPYLIHFDGWSTGYDYWTEFETEDIHPIGYQKYCLENRIPTSSRSILQQPSGRNDPNWTWESYLESIDAEPVPYVLFSEAQAKGCPDITADSGGVTLMCTKLNGRAEFREQNTYRNPKIGLRQCISDLKRALPQPIKGKVDVSLDSSAYRHHMVTPLPEGDLYTLLMHPSMSAISRADLSLHCLCNENISEVHFLNSKGEHMSKRTFLPDPFNLTPYNMLMGISAMHLITNSKILLPSVCNNLLGSEHKQVSDTVRRKLEAGIRKLSLYFLHNLSRAYNMIKNKEVQVDIKAEELEAPLPIPSDTQTTSEPSGDYLHTMYKYACACPSHMGQLNLETLGALGSYTNFITTLNLQDVTLETYPDSIRVLSQLQQLQLVNCQLETLPDNALECFGNLKLLNLKGNNMKALPPSMEQCIRLEELDISNNKFSSLSDNLRCESLKKINISKNLFEAIPDTLMALTQLNVLMANCCKIGSIPSSIHKLQHLHTLELQMLHIRELPDSLGELSELQELDISGIPWLMGYDSRSSTLTIEAYKIYIKEHISIQFLSNEELLAFFEECDPDKKFVLDHKQIQKLNAKLYEAIPRLGQTTNGQWPAVLNKLSSLKALKLSHQALTLVPDTIVELQHLTHIDVSHNPQLLSLPDNLGKLSLSQLPLKGCPVLKTPPKEIVSRGLTAILAYFKRLQSGSTACKRTKLMMVGLGGAGKTSLVQALTSGNYQSYGTQGENITDGIDITTWTVGQGSGDDRLTYGVWDFAGQTIYYNTHQFFLSNRAVYLLLWNIRLGYEHAGLNFWLNSISCHAPKAPIIIVGTHADQVEKFELPSAVMKEKFPQIVAFHNISTYTGMGVEALANELIEVTSKEKYMGEKVPEVWLSFEKKLLTIRKESVVELTRVSEIAVECGIMEMDELLQAVAFLHDLGSIVYFNNKALRDKVILNPQWIVDVMACVVNVHDSPIKDGKLLHKDKATIWHAYPPDLHDWLLKLTEVFDLTFPLNNEEAHLVPCLLPEDDPPFEWPDISNDPDMHRNRMLYNFEYLPGGLFNRLQVRLYQFSDSFVIWKKGSILKKRNHIALMSTINGNTVLVKVQGPRPENILFMIHEVLETLIAESFNGVTYTMMIPCMDCIKAGMSEPTMIPVGKIKQASDMKVPFLQCYDRFHTLSISEIQGSVPPDNSADFDIHLERCLHELNDLRYGLSTDIFISFCDKNLPPDDDPNLVSPVQIKKDLIKAGYSVWYNDKTRDIEDVTVAMKDSKVFVALISNEYVNDPHCEEMFMYATTMLKKTLQLIVVGQGYEWRNSVIGLQVTDEVFVNMQKKERYPVKIKELCTTLEKHLSTKTKVIPSCFISYCWSNSQNAIDLGSREKDGAIGWADPREIRKKLGENDIDCWLDIEQLGSGGGLFEDIAKGLRNAKVIVAFVSDEYAESKNCMLEFRFAAFTLRLPMILVVVGTGNKWRTSELGIIGLGHAEVSMQFTNPGGFEEILNFVKSNLPEVDDSDIELQEKQDQEGKQIAFKELLELLQRKFLRTVRSYEEEMSAQWPRLIVIDTYNSVRSHTGGGDTSQQGNDNTNGDGAPTVPMEVDDTGGNTGNDVKADDDTSNLEMKLFLKALCEHEGNWHTGDKVIPLDFKSDDEQMSFLKSSAGYTSRLIAILKHTSIDLDCLTSNKHGEKLLEIIDKHCDRDPDFKEEYMIVREKAFDLDEKNTNGSLSRCHLHNGKVSWLCEEHQLASQASTVTSGETAGHATLEDDTAMMLEHLTIGDKDKVQTQNETSAATKFKGAVVGAALANAGATMIKDQKKAVAASVLASPAEPTLNKKGSKACVVM